MVGTFVRLKLRLIAGSLRGDLIRQLGFGFSIFAAVVCALFGFLLFSLTRLGSAELALQIGSSVFTLAVLSWMIVPLLAFGLDETLDPSRLALFPLTTRQLATGMFAASATGAWPIASLVALFGGVVGLARGIGGVLLGLVAVPLVFALCLVASRLVTTALSGALRSRRGRDMLAVAVVFVVLLTQLPNLIINQGLPSDSLAVFRSTGDALRWTPPGLAAHAIADGGLVGVLDLLILAAVVVLLGWLWIVALRAALVRPDASNQGGSVRRSRRGGLIPDGKLGAILAKELKYARREPRGRVAWFSAVAVSGVMLFSLRGSEGMSGFGLVVGPAVIAAIVIGVQSSNTFGIDGRSLWMNAVAFGTERDLRTDFAGRQLANFVISGPLLAVVSVAAAVLAGNAGWAVPATLLAWCVLGLAMGTGSVLSVISPYTYPERMNAFSGAAPGQGGQAFVAGFGALLGAGLLALPVVIPTLFFGPWVSGIAVLYGAAVAWGGRRIASRIGFRRMPELLAAVSRPT
ncbi:transporter [Acrocarpospora macrocephala]|uniref:Transporter n=1 Tax=Acrocarpospora macrocephala TaxID=150177 RepID=A0A5M3X2G5_9ACTN|nr:transporter [Acrocarpospora macrocephala]